MALAPAAEIARAAAPSTYIIGRGADLCLIILSPLWALALGFVASNLPRQADRFIFFAAQVSFAVAFQTTLTHAHLVIAFFRSPANSGIFRQFPRRFTVVPAAVLAAQLLSHWVLLFAVAVTVLWDVYHSAMQTFGFGRIYDARRGVDPERGRGLDIGLNLLLYVGPILAGTLLLAHLNSLKRINEIGSRSFNSFGQAFLLMNVFHAVQYFAIVWWAERATIERTFRVHGAAAAIMHFWYDGFVWSVRKRQVVQT